MNVSDEMTTDKEWKNTRCALKYSLRVGIWDKDRKKKKNCEWWTLPQNVLRKLSITSRRQEFQPALTVTKY
jgi:hypothetical protein